LSPEIANVLGEIGNAIIAWSLKKLLDDFLGVVSKNGFDVESRREGSSVTYENDGSERSILL